MCYKRVRQNMHVLWLLACSTQSSRIDITSNLGTQILVTLHKQYNTNIVCTKQITGTLGLTLDLV